MFNGSLLERFAGRLDAIETVQVEIIISFFRFIGTMWAGHLLVNKRVILQLTSVLASDAG